MKTTTPLLPVFPLLLLAACAWLPGCAPAEDVDVVAPLDEAENGEAGAGPEAEGEDLEAALENLDDGLRQTWTALGGYSQEQKDRLSATLGEAARDLDVALGESLEDLDAQYEVMSVETRERLRSAKEDFSQELDELRACTADEWQEARVETREAWQKLVAAYEAARAELEAETPPAAEQAGG